jgi:4-hydroxy-tetrahydrodipicolinate reductase
MSDRIRVLVLGTGQMGTAIARLVLEKPWLELVGAYGRRTSRAGTDLGRAIGLGKDLGIVVEADLDLLVARMRPHVAIQATCSKLEDVWPEIATLLRHGVCVISIAEEMACPAVSSAEIAGEMNRLALAGSAAVVGTGINPGFVFDLLVVTLTGVCSEVKSITATRVNDLSLYGQSVLTAQGVGLTPEEFERGVAEGSIAGHYGFPQSIHLIAAALGWKIEHIAESREPIVSRVRRETPFAVVAPCSVAGCLHTAVGYLGGKPVITLRHPQQVRPELEGVETGDTIEIRGMPNIKFAGHPEIPGGQATAAIAVNMISRILNAPPGLHHMTTLPPPAAILGDVRRLAPPGRETQYHV